MTQTLDSQLDAGQLELLNNLTSPRKIQDFLDTTAYSPEYANRCPARMMADMQGTLSGWRSFWGGGTATNWLSPPGCRYVP
jgi:hypothetical protein